MGLLGNKNKNDMAYPDPDGRHPVRQDAYNSGPGGAAWQNNDPAYGDSGAGYGGQGYDNGGRHGRRHGHHDEFNTNDGYGPGPGAGAGAYGGGGVGARDYDDSYNTSAGGHGGLGPHHHQQQQQRYGENYEGAGPNAGASAFPMAPQTDAYGNPVKPGSGGSKMVGKVEAAVGTMIGSQSLKAKGEQKEQESRALKAQAAELNEAERLESAARARRERAVAHGAHPELRNLGGQPNNANTNTGGGLGGGQRY